MGKTLIAAKLIGIECRRFYTFRLNRFQKISRLKLPFIFENSLAEPPIFSRNGCTVLVEIAFSYQILRGQSRRKHFVGNLFGVNSMSICNKM